MIDGMEVRVDKSGRIAIPKALRERLGFTPNTELVAIERREGVLLRRAERGTPMVKVDGLWVHLGTAAPGAS
jgi:AbrB family looped-hinge helix DNA binding protein